NARSGLDADAPDERAAPLLQHHARNAEREAPIARCEILPKEVELGLAAVVVLLVEIELVRGELSGDLEQAALAAILGAAEHVPDGGIDGGAPAHGIEARIFVEVPHLEEVDEIQRVAAGDGFDQQRGARFEVELRL